MVSATVRLSCQQCQRRKSKCDKESPCSACKQAGLNCKAVERARLPRGRNVVKLQQKQTDSTSKATRLEDLLNHIEVVVPRQRT